MDRYTEHISPLRAGFLNSMINLQEQAFDAALKMQHDQMQLLSSWQRVAAAIHQDAWDRWSCRFGGGVPLDG